MRTNMQMIMGFSNWYPEERGFITGEEVAEIKKALELEGRDYLNLRNLRDMVVMYYGYEFKDDDFKKQIKENDKMSAICGIIDSILWNMGKEVRQIDT